MRLIIEEKGILRKEMFTFLAPRNLVYIKFLGQEGIFPSINNAILRKTIKRKDLGQSYL